MSTPASRLTPRQTISKIREYVGRPLTLTNHTIIQKMNDEVNIILIELGITRDNEAFKRFVLRGEVSTPEYQLNVSDWGRPFMAETWDEGADPAFIPREVTIAPVQERDRYRSGGYPGFVSADVVLSFFTESGQVKAMITPTPTEANSYRVYYYADWVGVAFNDLPLPIRNSFNPLLSIRTALAVLPDTEHDETKYERILSQLSQKNAQLTELMEHQKFLMNPDDNARSFFGWEREAADSWPWII